MAAISAASPPQEDRSRNRRIVEGALLADVAVVLLLARVYLPIPVARTAWRLLAVAPFVLLAERRGIRTMIMSGIVAYVLLTTLIGPTLALPALDTAFAAVIISFGARFRWPLMATVFAGGVVYAVLDIIIPTIAFAFLFRIPASTIIGDIRTGMRGATHVAYVGAQIIDRLLSAGLGSAGPRVPANLIRNFGDAVTLFVTSNWILFGIAMAVIVGIINMFGYQTAAELVLDRIEPSSRLRQAVS